VSYFWETLLFLSDIAKLQISKRQNHTQTACDISSESIPEGLAQVEFYASRNCLGLCIWSGAYIAHIQSSTVLMQIPIHWNLINRTRTTSPPVLSPSTILPPLLCPCFLIPARNILALFSKIVPTLLLFLKFLKSAIP
jgi:hypothetical protein